MWQLVTLSPVDPEVFVVVTVLLTDLTDVDSLGQLRVVVLPLRVENVGGDLTVRAKPGIGNFSRLVLTPLSWHKDRVISHLS